jgi:hypothetical protein
MPCGVNAQACQGFSLFYLKVCDLGNKAPLCICEYLSNELLAQCPELVAVRGSFCVREQGLRAICAVLQEGA